MSLEHAINLAGFKENRIILVIYVISMRLLLSNVYDIAWRVGFAEKYLPGDYEARKSCQR